LAASAAGKIIGTKSHIGDAARKGIPRSGVGCAVGMLTPARAAGARKRLRRHHHHAAVAHAALGDHVLGEVLHGAGLTLEHCHFHAAVMVEMDMQ
jgi:hypothetical protein